MMMMMRLRMHIPLDSHWCGCCPCTCMLIKNPIMMMMMMRTEDAYSTWSLTNVLCQFFDSLILVLTFLLMKLRVLFALPVMLFIWLFQFKSWEIVTSRYLALSAVSNTGPWKVYCGRSGCLALMIWRTWHLPGLNSMSQVRSHSWRGPGWSGEYISIVRWTDCKIDCCIIGKQSYLWLYVLWQLQVWGNKQQGDCGDEVALWGWAPIA